MGEESKSVLKYSIMTDSVLTMYYLWHELQKSDFTQTHDNASFPVAVLILLVETIKNWEDNHIFCS